MAVYPFMFASKKDFEPIVEEMVKVKQSSVSNNNNTLQKPVFSNAGETKHS